MADSRYIAIEGPIGVGKTILARRLAESLDAELLLEAAEVNPFLERFYRDPRGSALPTQLFFLFQRVRQIEELRQADIFSDTRIADFLIQKDRLFAELTLEREELRLYEQFAGSLDIEPPVPDLVIYLQAPVDTGSLDISFFRDDYSSRGLPDNPRASVLPMSVDGRVVILVDDVIHTGRSIRAAMNAIFELGRPRRVRLAVLVDRGGRDLPIAPDYCGCRITLPDHRRIELVDEGGLHLRIRDTPA